MFTDSASSSSSSNSSKFMSSRDIHNAKKKSCSSSSLSRNIYRRSFGVTSKKEGIEHNHHVTEIACKQNEVIPDLMQSFCGSDDEVVVMYEDGTPLFHAIEARDWHEASAILEEFPNQIRTWVVKNSSNPSTSNYKNDEDCSEYLDGNDDNDSTTPALLWKRLPIHEACSRQPPLWFVSLLLSHYPDSASATTVPLQELPLHLTVQHIASPEVVNVVMIANLEGVLACDKYERTPLDIWNQKGDDMVFIDFFHEKDSMDEDDNNMMILRHSHTETEKGACSTAFAVKSDQDDSAVYDNIMNSNNNNHNMQHDNHHHSKKSHQDDNNTHFHNNNIPSRGHQEVYENLKRCQTTLARIRNHHQLQIKRLTQNHQMKLSDINQKRDFDVRVEKELRQELELEITNLYDKIDKILLMMIDVLPLILPTILLAVALGVPFTPITWMDSWLSKWFVTTTTTTP